MFAGHEGVMIVDDSPVVLHAVEKMIQRKGDIESSVYTANSGEEALAALPHLEPDIVFLDVQMPGIDGVVTAQEIHTIAPETKIVVMTGQGVTDTRVKAIVAAGAFDVLEKPIHSEQIDEVLQLIERELSGAGRIR